MRAHVAVVVVGLVVLLGGIGCAREPESIDARVKATLAAAGEAARKQGYTQQAEALEDGSVSDAEYDELFSLFQECATGEGVELDPPVVSPIDGRRNLWWPKDSVPLATKAEFDSVTACQLRYVADVEAAVIEEPRRMAEPLRAYLESCLAPRGVRITEADDDIRDIMRAATSDHVDDLARCISEGLIETYPEIESVPFVPPVVY